MNPREVTVVDLAREAERLRQLRETFDQRKRQDERWFRLRLRMGYLALALLPTVAIVCITIIFMHREFEPEIVYMVAGALFADMLGMLIAVWKVILNPGSHTRLSPAIPESPPFT